MATIKELYEELAIRHTEATEARDLDGIMQCAHGYAGLLNQAPEEPAFIFSLASALMQVGWNGAAIQLYLRLLEYQPNNPDAFNNIGSAYRAEHDLENAEKYYRKALALQRSANYLNNMATLYINEGAPEEGEKWAREAVEANPDLPNAHWNLGLTLLEQAKWTEGFAEAEWGLMTGDRQRRQFDAEDSIPWWDGMPGKRVVIYGEQGLGDEIMFLSAMQDAMKSADVIYECHPRLEGMARRNFPDATVYPTRKDNELDWPTWEQIDAKLAIGSLFYLYRRYGQFPRRKYMEPDQELVEQYRKRMEEAGPGPYIGIGWQSGSKRTHQHHRNFKLSQLRPILEQDATFISVQYTDVEDKVERFHADTGIRIHHWPDAVQNFDMDHNIALAAALDLVIVPNTTMVHICGAVGTECWTMTPDKCAWRYSPGGDGMPFYGPWVHQFRQLGMDWDKVIAYLAKCLDGRLRNGDL